MKAAIGERVASQLSPPESMTDDYDRTLGAAQRIQAAIGAAALVAIWVFPPYALRQQLLVTALLLGVYAPWVALSRHSAKLSAGPVARVVNLSLDLAAVGVFALVIPSTLTVVMVAYTLVVAFHAYVSGRTAGLTMAVGSFAVVGTAQWMAPASVRHDLFTVVMYAVILAALASMVDSLAAERRRTARHLARLYQALESVAPEPTLAATADAIAASAQRAVNAAAVSVLLADDDEPLVFRVTGAADLPDDLRGLLRIAIDDPARSPSGLAMIEGRTISVPDFAADERFAWVTPTLDRYGVRSMVALPLGPASRPVGVLNAYFGTPAAVDDEDLHLLSAYARHVSLSVIRAQALEQERRAAERAAAADQIKADFVSTVSHELRTPLTSISGFVDTVLLRWDQLDDASKREILQRVARNTGDLRRLIEQILTFSTLAGGAAVDAAPYDVRRGITDLVEHMTPALQGCRVDVDIEPGLAVLATPEAMQHAIGNLLTNASKFSPPGSRINIRGRRDGAVARIAISDEGPGVPAEERERIFDRFYRGATTRSTRGTGIGLAIVRTSLEALGGDVNLRDSEPGTGATFEVTLPVADVAVGAPALRG